MAGSRQNNPSEISYSDGIIEEKFKFQNHNTQSFLKRSSAQFNRLPSKFLLSVMTFAANLIFANGVKTKIKFLSAIRSHFQSIKVFFNAGRCFAQNFSEHLQFG
jgi:hypothetical protein